MSHRTRSGSSLSPMLVEPTTSQKMTVTVFRTSRAVAGPGCRGAPHDQQYRARSSVCAPHCVQPLMADADYDALEDELRALVAEHPELAPDPNPLEDIGGPAVLHAPVRHSRPMLSLEKASTAEQLRAFFDRFPGQPVVVMPKLDG